MLRYASLFAVNYCADDGEDAYGETGINARQRRVNLTRQTFSSQTPMLYRTYNYVFADDPIYLCYLNVFEPGPVVFISSFRTLFHSY